MQQQPSPVACPELVKDVLAPTSGPVLLEVSMQALVAGGAPRGGWIPPVQNGLPDAEGGW